MLNRSDRWSDWDGVRNGAYRMVDIREDFT